MVILLRMVGKAEETSTYSWLNSKIQNGRHFWGEEIFLKIAKSTLLR